MAATWYPKFLEAQFTRPTNSDLSAAATVRAAFLTSAYVYNAAHQFRSDLTGVIGTPVATTARQFATDGTFDADFASYLGSELNGQTVAAIAIFIDTGTAGTSRLAMYLQNAPSLPLVFPGSGSVDQPFTLSPSPLGIASGAGDLWFPRGLQALMQRPSDSDPIAGTLKLVLLSAAYSYSSAHQFLSDLSGVVGTAQTLTNKTGTNGVLSADPVSFTVASGAQVT